MRATLPLCAGLLVLVLGLVVCGRVQAQTYVTEEEYVCGNPCPFASWMNVKSAPYNAAGNGTTDDRAAIQAALDDLGTAGKPSVLWFPAGTYKIAGTLYLYHKTHVALIGDEPSSNLNTSIIRWGGTDDGIMFWPNGVDYSRFHRLTFEGTNTGVGPNAKHAVYQAWDNAGGSFDTGNEYADVIFANVAYGLYCGDYGYGCAETTVLRSRFLTNTIAGIVLRNPNALDMWVWYSVFSNCGIGISNVLPSGAAGGFSVMHSYFTGSATTDIQMGNTPRLQAAFHNVSLNSNRFFDAGAIGADAQITLQGNRILDTIQDEAINIHNLGPVALLDNQIQSRVGATAPIVVMGHGSSALTAVGNAFTVASPISAAGQLIDIDTTVVTRAAIADTVPALPGIPASQGRTVYEPAALTGAAVQAAIDAAVAGGTTRPVVHLPQGSYSVSSTLTIPAGSTVQLVGDLAGDSAQQSLLAWQTTALGPVLALAGPTKVTLRDVGIRGNEAANAVVVSNSDQVGGRVSLFGVQLSQANVSNLVVNGLDQTLVDIRDLQNRSPVNDPAALGLSVIGGPLAGAGAGRTNVFTSLALNNTLSYGVSQGAKLLLRNCWYETPNSTIPGLLDVSSTSATLSLVGCSLSPYRAKSQPAVRLTTMSGTATFLTTRMSDRIVLEGSGTGLSVLALGVVQNNAQNTGDLGVVTDPFVNTTTSSVADARLFQAYQVPADNSTPAALTNEGTYSATFVTTMLAHLRGEVPTLLSATAADITDLRLFRVALDKTNIGLQLDGGGSVAVPIVLRLVR